MDYPLLLERTVFALDDAKNLLVEFDRDVANYGTKADHQQFEDTIRSIQDSMVILARSL